MSYYIDALEKQQFEQLKSVSNELISVVKQAMESNSVKMPQDCWDKLIDLNLTLKDINGR